MGSARNRLHRIALAFDAVQAILAFEPGPSTLAEGVHLDGTEGPQAGRLRVVAAKVLADPAGVAAPLREFLEATGGELEARHGRLE